MLTKKVNILITGCAGFIGFHLVKQLAKFNVSIYGIDNINNYYTVNLKNDRLIELGIDIFTIEDNTLISSNKYSNFHFIKADLVNHDFIVDFMIQNNFTYVINLAAQAGVRYSLKNPRAYLNSNIEGFLSILEGCRITNVKHLLYASTSSVYGLNRKMPLCEEDSTEHPVSFYASTKKANEMMAHSYSHLYNLPTTGLRFFTVYGPWGRPDMALSLFVDAIFKGEPIQIFNNGLMTRDFTFIDDIVESLIRLIEKPASINPNWDSLRNDPSSSSAPFHIFNIGSSKPIQLIDYILAIEDKLKVVAKKTYLPMQMGDVYDTYADVSKLENYINFKPNKELKTGISDFIDWFKEYYKV
jgi:UDP-glucuronate 4-epimerase